MDTFATNTFTGTGFIGAVTYILIFLYPAFHAILHVKIFLFLTDTLYVTSNTLKTGG
jgi:hypothetical protein